MLDSKYLIPTLFAESEIQTEIKIKVPDLQSGLVYCDSYSVVKKDRCAERG